jgi:aspartate aminotransferase
MSILSTSLSRIKESPTIAITQKARLLKESGKEVIALGWSPAGVYSVIS